MSSRDNERRVLDAIENQLRAEDPQLVGRFSAFGSVTPPIKPVNDRDGAARRRRVASAEGNGTRTGKHMPAVLELVFVIIASTLVAVLIAVAVWWMLTALSQLGRRGARPIRSPGPPQIHERTRFPPACPHWPAARPRYPAAPRQDNVPDEGRSAAAA
jgi:Protein of unknown function (DUF3040)